MIELPTFSTPDLAGAVEALSRDKLDALPFGVIRLDENNVVQIYNKTEAKNSGRDERPTEGRLFFIDVAPCMDNGYFKGRIEQARKAGKLNISFTFIGDFADRAREISVRAQAANDGGIWIFHQRAPSN